MEQAADEPVTASMNSLTWHLDELAMPQVRPQWGWLSEAQNNWGLLNASLPLLETWRLHLQNRWKWRNLYSDMWTKTPGAIRLALSAAASLEFPAIHGWISPNVQFKVGQWGISLEETLAWNVLFVMWFERARPGDKQQFTRGLLDMRT